MRPERLEPEALGVAGVVVAPGVLGSRAGNEFAGGGDGPRELWGGGRRNVDQAQRPSIGGRTSPVVVIIPFNARYRVRKARRSDPQRVKTGP
jgi:hypothetical protein